MKTRALDLKPSRNYPDIGTVGQDVGSLSANVETISQTLDIYQRNTKNLRDSFVRLGDLLDTGLFTLVGSQLIPGSFLEPATYLVSKLPDPAQSRGVKAYVSDANAPTFGSTVAGGGAVMIPVFSNGTNWIVGG